MRSARPTAKAEPARPPALCRWHGLPARSSTAPSRRARRTAFSLVELLVVVAILALLTGLLLPSLRGAREQARAAVCSTRLRAMATGLQFYAQEHRGRMMPLALPGGWPPTYWWGQDTTTGVDPTRGFLWPYLSADLRDDGLLECPSQPRGTLDQLQGAAKAITSTFGYNGYFLAPASTPGWSFSIGHRPWQRLDLVRDPARVAAFADTLILLGGKIQNSALLDPPMLYQGPGAWTANSSPTTAFRHRQRANIAFVDGHVAALPAAPGTLSSTQPLIGSASAENDPRYVPDWREW